MTDYGRPTTPKVSVLIPCFNAERWLAKAVESALMQSWPSVEIIVVDDGPTDELLLLPLVGEQFNHGIQEADRVKANRKVAA